ncbi:MAG: rhodanese-like domain-containing protein [Candidatus Calescibacterium sp.]|nr:rhodanese-like domain-containing protein [Candidatus Calescibacterium sp.]MDW8133035.1 rhodanese-like domain-containing protein [Candidatus Calescibacterium sp.]
MIYRIIFSMRYVFVFLVLLFIFLGLVFSNSRFMNIISNEPKFLFIDSKSFYDIYYNNRNTIVVDLRDYGDYKKSHIDGAIHFDVDNLFETYLGIPRKIKRVDNLIYTLSDTGIGTYYDVGIYSDNLQDAMVLASILHLFKVNGIYIIKDGFEGWKNNKLPISDKIKLVERGYFSPKISKSFYDSVIWDLKKTENQIGRFLAVAVSYSRIPLIPKSIYIKPKFSYDRYVTGSYYNSYDISKNKYILLYGNDNYEVLQVYFVLKLFLEYPNVVIFNGGINEWISNGLPVVQ